MQEINNQKANHKIEELEKTKLHLEQEVYVNKKRLEMETLATKQVTSFYSLFFPFWQKGEFFLKHCSVFIELSQVWIFKWELFFTEAYILVLLTEPLISTKIFRKKQNAYFQMGSILLLLFVHLLLSYLLSCQIK